ncbi:B3/B4 domain-containing protein [Desulfocucumis palustris]|uniref:B3/B4 domain-containing protein n=1 Tax=Desulfocucumis palustris TaxID=1898651 RepID=UPI000CEA6A08|nr:phenylalanine--tRNA ligase beta subunit-related protein [Desulfocucumis palustris]
MKFIIDKEVFRVLPTVCFGGVAAGGLDNTGKSAEILELLKEATSFARSKFQGGNLKEHPDLVCYRNAFIKIGFNPNKFLSSVEALTSRVLKGGELPDINDAVNLVNAISLKYTLPMGAHDLNSIEGDISVRYSREGEYFTPFGAGVAEEVPGGDLVYADAVDIRTRRWIWRQSDRGKVTAASSKIFFPIDGFTDRNLESVKAAREELANCIEKYFGVQPVKFYLDVDNPETETEIEI